MSSVFSMMTPMRSLTKYTVSRPVDPQHHRRPVDAVFTQQLDDRLVCGLATDSLLAADVHGHLGAFPELFRQLYRLDASSKNARPLEGEESLKPQSLDLLERHLNPTARVH